MISARLDLLNHGYQIEMELGANRVGGRTTYLATDLRNQQSVVIKLFQFATTDSSWSDYDAHEREIQILQSLDHTGIPRYLKSFQTVNGFCMVQEYKRAASLAAPQSFNTNQIRQIAISVLEILIYLQGQFPPVIHRDIKPANILIDQQSTIYLVDFGFARIGKSEVGISSVVKGTLGFMPPEQLFNRQLTEASDLYGLGMTLLCLLTGTSADEIGNLVDITYQIKFKHLLPKLSIHWVRWLEKMVEPRMSDRYPNAVAALQALPPTSMCLPQVQLSHAHIELTAHRIGELLNHSIMVNNPIPDTVLHGQWQVETHPGDRPPQMGKRPWLSFEPQSFEGNQIECQLMIDTGQLMTEKTYTRTVQLQTNALPEKYTLTLSVQTAPLPIQFESISYPALLILFSATFLLAWLNFWLTVAVGSTTAALSPSFLGNSIGAVLGLELAAWTLSTTGASAGVTATSIAGGILGGATLLVFWFMLGDLNGAHETTVVLSSLLGFSMGWILGLVLGIGVEKLLDRDLKQHLAICLSMLTGASATSLALGIILGLNYPIVVVAIAITGLSLVASLTRVYLRRSRIIKQYRKLERHRIRS